MKLTVGALTNTSAAQGVRAAVEKLAAQLIPVVENALIELVLAEIADTTMLKYGVLDQIWPGTRKAIVSAVEPGTDASQPSQHMAVPLH